MSTHPSHNYAWLFGVCLNDLVAKLLCFLPMWQWSESLLVIIFISGLHCRLGKADPSGANDEACGEVDFDICMWENHRSGVTPIADDSALALLGVLTELGVHEFADAWMLTDLRNASVNFGTLECFLAHLAAKQVSSAAIGECDDIGSEAQEPVGKIVVGTHALPEHGDGDDAIHAARIEGDVSKGFGE